MSDEPAAALCTREWHTAQGPHLCTQEKGHQPPHRCLCGHTCDD